MTQANTSCRATTTHAFFERVARVLADLKPNLDLKSDDGSRCRIVVSADRITIECRRRTTYVAVAGEATVEQVGAYNFPTRLVMAHGTPHVRGQGAVIVEADETTGRIRTESKASVEAPTGPSDGNLIWTTGDSEVVETGQLNRAEVVIRESLMRPELRRLVRRTNQEGARSVEVDGWIYVVLGTLTVGWVPQESAEERVPIAVVGAEERELPCDHPLQPEDELNQIIMRLNSENSRMINAKLLLRGKELYEAAHPETRHGGDRRSSARREHLIEACQPWPSYARHMADKTRLSRSTVQRRLLDGEDLAGLAPDVEAMVFGDGLANDLKILVRIAKLRDHQHQRTVTEIIVDGAGYALGLEALRQAEARQAVEDGAVTAQADGDALQAAELVEAVNDEAIVNVVEAANDEVDAGDLEDEEEVLVVDPAVPLLAEIMQLLGVSTHEECIPVLRQRLSEATEYRVLMKSREPITGETRWDLIEADDFFDSGSK